MTAILEAIFQTQSVIDADGSATPVHSHTSAEQGRFLQSFVAQDGINTCLEIGLAFGISSLFIGEALAQKPSPRFISIDPLQQAWKNIGRLNLERAGYAKFTEFHERPSCVVLAEMLARGDTIDFAYVDTTKLFDIVMTDAMLISHILRVGGYVVFDDCGQPGVRAVVRYLARWPCFRVAGVYNKVTPTRKRIIAEALAKLPIVRRAARQDLVTTDSDLGINAECVALQKVSEDDRRWDCQMVP